MKIEIKGYFYQLHTSLINYTVKRKLAALAHLSRHIFVKSAIYCMQTTNKLVPITCNSISDQSSAKYGAKLHLQLKVPTGTKVTRNIGLVWFTLRYERIFYV